MRKTLRTGARLRREQDVVRRTSRTSCLDQGWQSLEVALPDVRGASLPPMGTHHLGCRNCCGAPLDVPLGEVEALCEYCRSRLRFLPEENELEVEAGMSLRETS
jgi:hypothetical protein